MILQKTKKLLIVLLSICLIACCGIFVLTTNTVNAAAPTTFKMQDGAYVRVSNDYADNGIRFIAEIEKTEYEGLEGEKTAGVFIMPKHYLTAKGMLNEANTFGASSVYTWEGKSATPETGKTTIIHMNSQPVLNGEVYEIKGSVVNLKEANLNLDYVGQAYIKAGDTYYFAETEQTSLEANGRSIVSMSQSALIKGGLGTTETTNLQGYLSKYLTVSSGSVTRSVAKEVYIENGQGEFVKSTTLSDVDDVTIDSATDFTTEYVVEDTTLTGHRLIPYYSETSAYPSNDQSGAVKLYYEKNSYTGFASDAVDNIIFSSATTGEGDVFARNGLTKTGLASANVTANDKFSYYGGSDTIQANAWGWDWAHLEYTTPVQLPISTNLFSVVLYTVSDSDANGTHNIQFGLNGSVTRFTIPAVNQAKRYYFTLPSSVSEITKLSFCLDNGAYATNGYCTVAIDSLRWESELYTGSDYYATSTDTTVTVGLDPIASTIYTSEEIAGMDIDIAYKGANANGVATPVSGSAQLDVQGKSYTVEVSKDNVVVNTYRIFGNYPYFVTTFDKETEMAATNDNPFRLDYANSKVVGNSKALSDVASFNSNSVDGDKSLYINGTSPSASYLRFADTTATANKGITKLGMWVYSTSNRTLNIATVTVNIGSADKTSKGSVSVKKDEWNYVEFEFDTLNSISYIKLDDSIVNGAFGWIYIDRITFA